MKQAVSAGRIKATDTVVCVITGTAFGRPEIVQHSPRPQRTLRAEVGELKGLLEELGMLGGSRTMMDVQRIKVQAYAANVSLSRNWW